LFLENCAGGVHDQLWQKSAVEETEEIKSDEENHKCAGAPADRNSTALTISPHSARIMKVIPDQRVVSSQVGLWRSWERASMAWKRSSVRSRPGPPNLLTMPAVYILQSQASGKFYIGCAGDAAARLKEHNRGQTLSTRGRGPWILVYQEQFDTLSQARMRERQLKSWKSHRSIQELIDSSEYAAERAPA
jgi:putative endonuclease